MTELTQDLSLAQARSLIDSYAFDLGYDDVEKLFKYWLDLYSATWIRLATIEALYLGRYKVISVEQILHVWLRLGTPNTHFTYEFERLICRKLPKHLSDLSGLTDNSDNSPQEPSFYSHSHSEDVPLTAGESKSEVNEMKLAHNTKWVAENSRFANCNALNLSEANLDTSAPESNILISGMGMSYQSNWSDSTEKSNIIHQFIPLPDVSSFFARLKTFGEEQRGRR